MTSSTDCSAASGFGIVEDGAWTVTAEPVQEHGLGQVVMRSGDLVRRVNERFADDYMLLEVP